MKRYVLWLALGLLSMYLVYLMIIPFIDVLVYSVFVYYIGRPVYRRLVKRIRSHAVSAFVTLFILLLPVTFVVVYGFGVAAVELLNFMDAAGIPYATTINSVLAESSSVLAELRPQDIVMMVEEDPNFHDLWGLSTSLFLSAMGVIFRVMLMFTIALYLLMDGQHLRDWAVTVFSPPKKDLTEKFFKEVDRDLHGVFFGSIMTAMLIAILGSMLFFTLNQFAPATLRIPYSVLLGMVCGVTSLVPAVGVALFWVPASIVMVAYAYMNGVLWTEGWFIIAFAALTAVFVDWGPNILFKPQITGKRIHPGLMMMAYLLGPIAFGLAGLFIGPIVLVVSLNFAKVVLPEIRH
ncbi:MAG: AI-2E family transporter [Candidatus Altiarchaeales archaeon]|nr:AI-2E family transporter [Candidatus Altiarchaeales archaeon]MBD3417106.1 AI-2E family transporter [Candidatus Altiarchaeales archaeon]